MLSIRICIIAGTIMLSGCTSASSGTAGRLFSAPSLAGEVRNSVYYAADNSFSVNTPFTERSYSYKYLEIKEQYANIGAYVSFITPTHPNEVYRIEIGRKLNKTQPSPPFDQLVESLVENYKQQLTKYGSRTNEEWRTSTTLDGKKAVLVTMRQELPALNTYLGPSKEGTVHHIIYIVESPNGGGGAVWVQWPNACDACQTGPEAEILSIHERVRSFIQSFRLRV